MMRLFSAALLALGLFTVDASAGEGRARILSHWNDLSSPEESRVVRAVLGLASQPEETLAFLKERLRPVKDDPARVAELLADLASEKFAVRDRANAELEYYGKYIKPSLEKALAEKPSLEMERRIHTLLSKMPQPPKKVEPPAPPLVPGKGVSISIVNNNIIINGKPLEAYMVAPPGPAGPPAPPSSWVRAARVVGVLEHIGTPPARELIERLASGEADALPTMEARAAQERMSKGK